MPPDIIREAINGDRRAINHLLEKHRDFAFSIALKYVNNSDDAEDIVQNAFIKVFLNIRKFRNESAFSTWLYKIVYCEACRLICKQRKMLTIKDEVGLDLVENETASAISIDERGREIKDLMQCLSANEYLVINLFYLLEKSIVEIQNITGHTNSNIKVLLHRARIKLAASWQFKK